MSQCKGSRGKSADSQEVWPSRCAKPQSDGSAAAFGIPIQLLDFIATGRRPGEASAKINIMTNDSRAIMHAKEFFEAVAEYFVPGPNLSLRVAGLSGAHSSGAIAALTNTASCGVSERTRIVDRTAFQHDEII